MTKPRKEALRAIQSSLLLRSGDPEFDQGLTVTLAVNICIFGVFIVMAAIFWFFVMADRGDLHSLPAAVAHASTIVGWAQLPWIGLASAITWARGKSRFAYGVLCIAADTAIYTVLWYISSAFIQDLLWLSSYTHVAALLSFILLVVAGAHSALLRYFISELGLKPAGWSGKKISDDGKHDGVGSSAP